MEYIINPSWFYWIEVSDCIKVCAIIAAVILLIAAIVLAIVAKMDDDFNEYRSANVKRKVFIYCLVALAVCVAVIIFVPSKRTLIEMMIAKKATYDNVSWTIEQVKEAVDYIISAIEEIK